MELTRVDVSKIKGIGPMKRQKLLSLGISNVEELITYYPCDYIDRTLQKDVASIMSGELVCIRGQVISPIKEIIVKNNLKIYETKVSDETGTVKVTWFNQTFIKFKIKMGQRYIFFGRVDDKKLSTLVNPVFEEIDMEASSFASILPVYRLTYGISQTTLRQILRQTLGEYQKYLSSKIPQDIIARYNLSDYQNSVANIHFPQNFEQLNLAKRTLVFEELFNLQIRLIKQKVNIEQVKKKRKYVYDKKDIDVFIKNLPFELTNAQQKVLEEITGDLDSDRVMNRLLQGDVGSGKTVIAAISILKVVKSGFQAILMAPTEVLAKQHFEELSGLYEGLNISVKLLTGSMKKTLKQESKMLIGKGEADVVVGTHAIIQEDVLLKNLALVITDEQHRFGVRQRTTATQKGVDTDVLVMSATPIPRTLALILYGDLDISIIDEMPKGRIPIETFIVNESKRDRLNNFITENINDGGQVFVVCPLIEDSEKLENLASVTSLWNEHSEGVFKSLKVGILHGKMSEADKDKVIEEFSRARLDILVSTTVIEVGVNIPNANIMVVENAERFGLSQLHQLRGRVGRGGRKSYCILFNQSESQDSFKRLQILKDSNDGFIISEKDLDLRGPGEFFGNRQHGIPSLKIANLAQDKSILIEVQEACKDLVRSGRIDSIEAYVHSDKINL